MSARIVLRLFGGATVFLAILGAVGCDARVKEVEDQKTVQPTKPDKDEEYVRAMAGAMMDALLAGDVAALDGKMTPKMLKGIDASVSAQFHQAIPNANTWITNWNKQKQFKTYAIDKVAMSPNKDEAVIQGTLTGQDEALKGAFTMTLVKDKGDKYLLDACTMKVR